MGGGSGALDQKRSLPAAATGGRDPRSVPCRAESAHHLCHGVPASRKVPPRQHSALPKAGTLDEWNVQCRDAMARGHRRCGRTTRPWASSALAAPLDQLASNGGSGGHFAADGLFRDAEGATGFTSTERFPVPEEVTGSISRCTAQADLTVAQARRTRLSALRVGSMLPTLLPVLISVAPPPTTRKGARPQSRDCTVFGSVARPVATGCQDAPR